MLPLNTSQPQVSISDDKEWQAFALYLTINRSATKARDRAGEYPSFQDVPESPIGLADISGLANPVQGVFSLSRFASNRCPDFGQLHTRYGSSATLVISEA